MAGVIRRRSLLLYITVVCVIGFLFFFNLDSYSIAEQRERLVKGMKPTLSIEGKSLDIVILGSDTNGSLSSKKPRLTQDAETCNIPKLDINGSEVISFFHHTEPFACPGEANWAYIDDDRKFVILEEHQKNGAVCTITPFWRQSDAKLSHGAPRKIPSGTVIDDNDFGRVFCKDTNGKSWRGLVMTVTPQRAAIDRAEKSRNRTSPPNVIFLGFDSLSQMSFRRKLPKAVKYLEDELGTVVLNGYNIVGDGTPQAFIPILTGQTEVELPLTRKRFKEANYVDDVYPFLWKNFSDAGYVTLYGEDAASIGTFTYRLKGFRNQPTDHYLRTYFQESEKSRNWKCSGSEPIFKSWFRYVLEFMRGYSKVPRFLLMHHSLHTHDDINEPGVLDDDLKKLLHTLNLEGYFDNSLLVVMADHGHRFAKLRNTQQGQLEERLPFFAIRPPTVWSQTEAGKVAIQNLKDNANRLTSPFDIHATLSELLNWPESGVGSLNVEGNANVRELSLFRPIPKDRTCSQAGIEPHWCTCLSWEPAMTGPARDISETLALAVVSVMNTQTLPERKLCAPLGLKELIDSKRLVPKESLLHYKAVKDADGFVPDLSGTTRATQSLYQIKFSTQPGRAIYEVTVAVDLTIPRVTVDLTAISHVNKFGDDPHCIISKNYFLATFCVCYDRV